MKFTATRWKDEKFWVMECKWTHNKWRDVINSRHVCPASHENAGRHLPCEWPQSGWYPSCDGAPHSKVNDTAECEANCSIMHSTENSTRTMTLQICQKCMMKWDRPLVLLPTYRYLSGILVAGNVKFHSRDQEQTSDLYIPAIHSRCVHKQSQV
jgi:hypothetical protein